MQDKNFFPGSRKHQDESRVARNKRQLQRLIRTESAIAEFTPLLDSSTTNETAEERKAEKKAFLDAFRRDLGKPKIYDHAINDPQLASIVSGAGGLASRAILIADNDNVTLAHFGSANAEQAQAPAAEVEHTA